MFWFWGLLTVLAFGILLIREVLKESSPTLNFFIRTGWYLPIHCLVGAYCVFLGKYGRRVMEKSFPLLHECTGRFIGKGSRWMNEQLYADFKIKYPQSSEGPRILEIGPGSGRTIEFLPENCQITYVEPNAEFRPVLEQKLRLRPGIKLENFYQAYAEDMHFLDDESFDLVISSKVLCSVKDVRAVLKEARRVLKPGGKLYILEHGMELQDKLKQCVQIILNNTWVFSYLFLGCSNKNIQVELRRAGFSTSELRSGNYDTRFLPFTYCNTPIYYGAVTATS